ncbi:MAG: AAA family ATPase [Anaerolineae bacterium]
MNDTMLRVSVVGTSGCGKTTFARRLAQIIGCEHVELDAIHWQPNWQVPTIEAFHDQVAQAAARERWVIDGNYSHARDLVWDRATHVIWLNYPFLMVFTRLFYRTISRIITQEELFPGCRESLKMTLFSRKSILWWMISTYGKKRKRYRALFQQQARPHLTMIELRNQRQADRWLLALKENGSPPGLGTSRASGKVRLPGTGPKT